MTPVTTATLDAALADRSVVLDFTAPWCTACKALLPTLLEFEKTHAVPVLSVDVDDWPEVAERFGVLGLPTVLRVDRGRVTARHTGAGRRTALEALFTGR
mgnify:CR=1 FL=1|jgi:thioredoxin 1